MLGLRLLCLLLAVASSLGEETDIDNIFDWITDFDSEYFAKHKRSIERDYVCFKKHEFIKKFPSYQNFYNKGRNKRETNIEKETVKNIWLPGSDYATDDFSKVLTLEDFQAKPSEPVTSEEEKSIVMPKLALIPSKKTNFVYVDENKEISKNKQDKDPNSDFIYPSGHEESDGSTSQNQDEPKDETQKNGRGTRNTNDNQWIRLTFPGYEDEHKDPTFPPSELLTSRMPKVKFVTQKKRMDNIYEASEAHIEREPVPKSNVDRNDDELRTDFIYPDNRARDEHEKAKVDIAPRQADMFYPESRGYYEDDLPVKHYEERPRQPFVGTHRHRYPPIERTGRLPYDNTPPRKSRRIIYYASLPEVVRTPPIVDMRNRYALRDPYRRYDVGYYTPRESRYYDYNRDHYTRPYSRDYRDEERYSRDTYTTTLPPPVNVDKKDQNHQQNDKEKKEKEEQPSSSNSHQNANYPLRVYDDYPYERTHKYYSRPRIYD